MSLKAFDVNIKFTPDPALTTAGATVDITKQNYNKSGVANVSITDLPIGIGDKFYNALRVEITGTPSVDVVFKMTCHIDYDYNVAYKYSDGKYYMPLGYTIHFGDAAAKQDVCHAYHNKTSDELEEIILRNVYNKLYNTNHSSGNELFKKDSSSNYYFEKEFTPTSSFNTKMNSFYLGFEWPHTYNNMTNADEIATYLSEQNSGIKIVYSFSIEQKT